jgi:hypothetical protein
MRRNRVHLLAVDYDFPAVARETGQQPRLGVRVSFGAKTALVPQFRETDRAEVVVRHSFRRTKLGSSK